MSRRKEAGIVSRRKEAGIVSHLWFDLNINVVEVFLTVKKRGIVGIEPTIKFFEQRLTWSLRRTWAGPRILKRLVWSFERR